MQNSSPTTVPSEVSNEQSIEANKMGKRNVLFAIPLLMLLASSCATLFNGQTTEVTIRSNAPTTLEMGVDTFRSFGNEIKLTPERSAAPLTLTIQRDTITKTVVVPSKLSLVYWSNFATNFGIGLFWDNSTPKRFTYPRQVFINVKDTAIRWSKVDFTEEQNVWNLVLSLPHVNSFYQQPAGEGVQKQFGYLGARVGLRYRYAPHTFAQFTANGAIDLPVPFPAPVDYSGESKHHSTSWISLTHGHWMNRWSLGYGIAFARNTWEWRYNNRFNPPPPTRSAVKRSHNALGAEFPVNFQLTNGFHAGLLYRPTFITFNNGAAFNYEHLLSIQIGWRIRL